MSADNGFLLRQRTDGKFVLQMYFASDDRLPDVEDTKGDTFDTFEEAVLAYAADSTSYDGMYWSEYGLSIKLDMSTRCDWRGPLSGDQCELDRGHKLRGEDHHVPDGY